MSRAWLKLSACILAACLLGTACGGGGDGEAAPPTVPPYDETKGVASPAAELRSDLTAVLQEHALLIGLASSALLAGQDNAPIVAVLDQNGAALASIVSGLYGEPTGTQFLDGWRRHAAGLLEFAAASASADADKARIDKAKSDLTTVQGEIAATLNAANPQLTVEALGEEFEAYSRGLQTAITAQAKQDATAVVKLKDASDHMAETAIVLAAGIIKHRPEEFEGPFDSRGAAMRAELTSKLQEYTYLAGVAGGTVLAGGDMEPSADAIEENALELARAFGTVYGDDVQRRFLELWRDHVKYVVDFAEGARAADPGAMAAARRGLDGYRSAFASFLSEANPNLARQQVEETFGVHLDRLLVAISAQAANDPARVARLKEAADHAPDTALFLATGIAKQFPTKFG